ncbi:MAG: LptF/LptG family permease [Candidatus Latescibacterota bacterium]
MSILTRYILKEFISFLGYSLLAFAVIFILIDSVEMMDKFIDSDAGLKLIFIYYLFYLPFILVLTLPLSMLLATTFSLGRLVGDNEITAMKAAGISLYRIFLPIYIFALFMSLAGMVMAEAVVPWTNIQRQDVRDVINARRMGNKTFTYHLSFSKTHELDRDDVFLINRDGRIIHSATYHSQTKTAQNVFIINTTESVMNSDTGTAYKMIASRIDADSLVYSQGNWTLYQAVERIFTDDGVKMTHYSSLPAPFITRKPSDFAKIDLKPESMDYFELRNFIKGVKEKGGNASQWLIDLYLKIAFPFVTFVIVFFGAPLAAGSVKRGKTAAFGIALIISFMFYTCINILQVLGRTGTMDPIIAAWLSNILFFCIGFILLMKASK